MDKKLICRKYEFHNHRRDGLDTAGSSAPTAIILH
jgi:hypothetical protein